MIGTNVNCHDTRLGLQRKHGTIRVQCLFTLSMLGNFTSFLSSAGFVSKSTFSKNSFRNTVRASNSFGPDLVPYCLQRFSTDDASKQRV